MKRSVRNTETLKPYGKMNERRGGRRWVGEGRTVGREKERERKREGTIAERPDVTRQRITTTRS